MYLERKNLKNLLLRYLDEGFHFSQNYLDNFYNLM